MLTQEDQFHIVNALAMKSWSLKAGQMRALQGAYVYVLYRDGMALYVGVKSSKGERPFYPDHRVLGGPWPDCENNWEGTRVQPDDELMICPMGSGAIAQWAERVLIERLKPEWNRQRVFADTWTQFPTPEEPNERAGLDLALL